MAHVTLPEELYAKLDRLARERGVTVSEVVREATEPLVAPTPKAPSPSWEWPTVDVGGVKDVPVELWRELANPSGEYLERDLENR